MYNVINILYLSDVKAKFPYFNYDNKAFLTINRTLTTLGICIVRQAKNGLGSAGIVGCRIGYVFQNLQKGLIDVVLGFDHELLGHHTHADWV